MRNVAEVLKVVIECGHYDSVSYFMCDALSEAFDENHITEEEMLNAEAAIQKYMVELCGRVTFSLLEALDEQKLVEKDETFYTLVGFDEEHTRAYKYLRRTVCSPIYLDWDNRPFPEQKYENT